MTRLTTDVNTLAQFINLVHFPCDKRDLIEYANSHNAPEDVREALEQMPEGHFQDSGEVTRALGISGSVRQS